MFYIRFLVNEATPIIIVFLTILGLIILILTILLIRFFIKKKYRDFIKLHSVGLKKLIEINRKYKFHNIPDYYLEHTYDNRKMFADLTCEDYLIYNLVSNKNKVINYINLANENKLLNLDYEKEIRTSCKKGEFDTDCLPKNTNKLLYYEELILEETKLNPQTEFYIIVNLKLVNMNYDFLYNKQRTYFSDSILCLIARINNKSGHFYQDEGVWQSICKIERAKVSNKMRFKLYSEAGNRCKRCGRYFNNENLEIDHIIPISKGGKSTYTNLQVLCKQCNYEKGDHTDFW